MITRCLNFFSHQVFGITLKLDKARLQFFLNWFFMDILLLWKVIRPIQKSKIKLTFSSSLKSLMF
jgi:hypothetical protein